jgi:hypothetical protein
VEVFQLPLPLLPLFQTYVPPWLRIGRIKACEEEDARATIASAKPKDESREALSRENVCGMISPPMECVSDVWTSQKDRWPQGQSIRPNMDWRRSPTGHKCFPI